MEVKLLCAAVLLVSILTGLDAQSDVCGTVPLNTRIVGGEDAAEGAWPWQVSIRIYWFFCGGSLINNQWVLTAAQCFSWARLEYVTVYLGRHTQAGPNPHEQNRTVMQVIKHPAHHQHRRWNNDIALVKLSSPVAFNDYIRPVCLAAADSVYEDGTNTWVTGWGQLFTFTPLPSSEPLQELEIPITSNEKCKKIYTGITDNMICAVTSSEGKNICYGDRGGPMVTKTDSRWVQAGVSSFILGFICASPNIPSGFTRVSRYESWIRSHIITNEPGFVTYSTPAPSGVGPTTGDILTVLLSLIGGLMMSQSG